MLQSLAARGTTPRGRGSGEGGQVPGKYSHVLFCWGSSGAFGFPWRPSSMGRGSWPRWANLLQPFLGRGINAPHPAAHCFPEVFAFGRAYMLRLCALCGVSQFGGSHSAPGGALRATPPRVLVLALGVARLRAASTGPAAACPRVALGGARVRRLAPPCVLVSHLAQSLWAFAGRSARRACVPCTYTISCPIHM